MFLLARLAARRARRQIRRALEPLALKYGAELAAIVGPDASSTWAAAAMLEGLDELLATHPIPIRPADVPAALPTIMSHVARLMEGWLAEVRASVAHGAAGPPVQPLLSIPPTAHQLN